MRKGVLLTALAAALLALPPAAPASDSLNLRLDFGGYRQQHEFFSAKRMIGGARVVDSVANDVGQVRDLLVADDGRIDSLVIEGGGVLGIGRTLFPYPWDKAMVARPDLVKLPFDTGRIASYRDRFGDVRNQQPPHGRHRLGDFMGRSVYVHGGMERFGTVADAMIDIEGRVMGLVISPVPGVAATTALYAVPFRIEPSAGYSLRGERYILPHGLEPIRRLDQYRAALKATGAE